MDMLIYGRHVITLSKQSSRTVSVHLSYIHEIQLGECTNTVDCELSELSRHRTE